MTTGGSAGESPLPFPVRIFFFFLSQSLSLSPSTRIFVLESDFSARAALSDMVVLDERLAEVFDSISVDFMPSFSLVSGAPDLDVGPGLGGPDSLPGGPDSLPGGPEPLPGGPEPLPGGPASLPPGGPPSPNKPKVLFENWW